MDFREMQRSLLIKATKAHFCQNIEKILLYQNKPTKAGSSKQKQTILDARSKSVDNSAEKK